MRRRFEFEEGSSSKFWEVEIDDSSVTTWWGKIGTGGQSKTKDFGTSDKAQKEYDKLVAEKVGKGYEEVGEGHSTAAPKAATPKPTKAAVSPAKAPAVKAPAKKSKAADEDEDEECDEPCGVEPCGDKRRFEFEEGNSSKFWEIALNGDSLTTWWGRKGTSGQTKTLNFDSEDEAEKQYEKLIAEKTKKGYEEV